MKIHYIDIDHDNKIPIEHRTGYGTICGYQREKGTHIRKEVDCKLCLREMKKKGLIE